jgi:hypothetical protein
MSRGPGSIEKRIADLFAATRDRALTIDDITRAAFALSVITAPTRAQRLSATRAAHRLLRRVREDWSRIDQSADEAEREKLYDKCKRVGVWFRFLKGSRPGLRRIERDHWCTTTINGRLYFHPPDVPVRVWAVSIGRGGITWAEATVIKVTTRNVMVRYADETARLDRRGLWYWWAWWRHVMFVSSRTGRIAAELDQLWWKRYGAAAKARGVDVTEVTSPLRNIANFLKHADRDPTAKIDLEEDHIEIVLFYACHDFGRVAGGMPIEAQVFEAWAYAAATKRVSDLPLRGQQLIKRIIATFPGLRGASDRAKQKKIGLKIMERALRDKSLEMAMMREVPSRTPVNAATAPKPGRGQTPRRHS